MFSNSRTLTGIKPFQRQELCSLWTCSLSCLRCFSANLLNILIFTDPPGKPCSAYLLCRHSSHLNFHAFLYFFTPAPRVRFCFQLNFAPLKKKNLISGGSFTGMQLQKSRCTTQPSSSHARTGKEHKTLVDKGTGAAVHTEKQLFSSLDPLLRQAL